MRAADCKKLAEKPEGVFRQALGSPGLKARGAASLSKNFQNTPVSGIIEETGVLLWKAGEKMHGEKQSLWI